MELAVEAGEIAVGEANEELAVAVQERQRFQRLLGFGHPTSQLLEALAEAAGAYAGSGQLAERLGGGYLPELEMPYAMLAESGLDQPGLDPGDDQLAGDAQDFGERRGGGQLPHALAVVFQA